MITAHRQGLNRILRAHFGPKSVAGLVRIAGRELGHTRPVGPSGFLGLDPSRHIWTPRGSEKKTRHAHLGGGTPRAEGTDCVYGTRSICAGCAHLAEGITFLGPRKVEIRLPGKGDSNSHGARPVHQKHRGIRTSRLSIKQSLSHVGAWCAGKEVKVFSGASMIAASGVLLDKCALNSGLWVQGSGYRVQDSGFRVQG